MKSNYAEVDPHETKSDSSPLLQNKTGCDCNLITAGKLHFELTRLRRAPALIYPV